MLIFWWSDFGTYLKDSKVYYPHFTLWLPIYFTSSLSNNFHAYIGLDPRNCPTLASFCQPFEDAEWFKIVGETQGQTHDQLVLQRRCYCISFEKSWEVYLGIGFCLIFTRVSLPIVHVFVGKNRHIQNYVIVWERPSFNSRIALWPFLILHVSLCRPCFFSKELGEHRTKPTEVEETFELGKVPHHRRYAKWPFDAQHMLLGQNYDFGPKCETSSFFGGGPIGRWVCVCVCWVRSGSMMIIYESWIGIILNEDLI